MTIPAWKSPMNGGADNRESQQILSALGAVFRRRKAILLLCQLGVLAPIVYYNETAVPVYEATSSLVFEEFSSPVPNDVSSTPSRELYLFNRIEEINSRSFAEDIAKALPDSVKTRFSSPVEKSGNADPIEHISDVIHQSITAYPVRTSNIVRIRVQMNDPHLCMVVANMSQDVLQERNYRIRHEGVSDVRRFIEEQLARFKAQLQASEYDLMNFKERNRITSLDSESKETLRKVTEAEVQYNATRADRGAAMQRLASVMQTLSAQRRELVPSVMSLASPSAQSLKVKLIALQTQYAQLVVQDYAVDHPQLVRLRQEIELTKKSLTDEAMKLAKGGSVGDPIAQIERYVQESVSLQIEIESLRARENALKRTVEEYRKALGNLPSREVELARLVRERDVSEKIYTGLLERREEIRISEAKQIPTSRVIDRAQLPKDPIKPRKRLNMVAGVTLGLIFGLGVGLFLESGARKLGSMVEFEQETGWPVLGIIPMMKGGPAWRNWPWGGSRRRRGSEDDRRKALVSHFDPDSAAGESYFMLRTRLELLGMGGRHRSLLVTSCGPRDGKSNTLANLAATFGTAGRAALVVDAELRRPVMHSIFGIPKGPGLTDLLLGRNGDGTGLRAEEKKAYQETKVNGVTVIAGGKRVQETQWEACRAKMGALLNELGKSYDVVLVDSASPILVHDTLVLCGIVDAVLIVVDARSYDVRRLMETRRLLEHSGANVVGVVVNKIDPSGAYSYYYSHHYSHQDPPAERSVGS